ncbi:hypothetical protein [Palleronia sp.]|uniref:hypothetical protein n=1 Tax=Palleronia sp. TaxID=1940284 RepID=UPI0035C79738
MFAWMRGFSLLCGIVFIEDRSFWAPALAGVGIKDGEVGLALAGQLEAHVAQSFDH